MPTPRGRPPRGRPPHIRAAVENALIAQGRTLEGELLALTMRHTVASLDYTAFAADLTARTGVPVSRTLVQYWLARFQPSPEEQKEDR